MTKTIDLLNTLLRGEISAVETHKIAIAKLAKASFIAVLRQSLASHERRVRDLDDEITRLGGTPADSSGAWGTFVKLIEGAASAFGERASVSALAEGEDHGCHAYQRELATFKPPTLAFVRRLHAEQLESHAAISALENSMTDMSPPTEPRLHN